MNDRGIELLGAVHPDQVIGRSLLEFLHPDCREQAQERTRRFLAGETVDPVVEGKILRIDGIVIDVERSVACCTYGGEPAFQSVIYDITERKTGEQAIVTAQADA